ncbi:MAG: hypothetical protein ACKVQJ_06190 [Pyrinomonadaceae bacterium]
MPNSGKPRFMVEMLSLNKKRPQNLRPRVRFKFFLSGSYDSLGCGAVLNSRSIAALVSPVFLCLRSVTHSVTVDTISRAAVRELAAIFTWGETAAI